MSRSVRYSKYTVGPLVASALEGITAFGTPSFAEDLVDRTPVLVRGVVVDAEEGVPLEESEGLEGVVVCVHPQSEKSNYGDCVKTAANGEFELPNVPHNANVLIKFCATEQCKVPGVGSDGLIPTIRMIHTTDNDELIMVIRTPMLSEGDLGEVSIANVVTQADTNAGIKPSGSIAFFAVDKGDEALEGFAVNITTAARFPTADGGERRLPVSQLSEPTPTALEYGVPESDGSVPGGPPRHDGGLDDTIDRSTSSGNGAQRKLAPGDYLVSFQHDRTPCTIRFSETGWAPEWGSDDVPRDDTVRARVVTKFMTVMVGMQCRETQPDEEEPVLTTRGLFAAPALDATPPPPVDASVASLDGG